MVASNLDHDIVGEVSSAENIDKYLKTGCNNTAGLQQMIRVIFKYCFVICTCLGLVGSVQITGWCIATSQWTCKSLCMFPPLLSIFACTCGTE